MENTAYSDLWLVADSHRVKPLQEILGDRFFVMSWKAPLIGRRPSLIVLQDCRYLYMRFPEQYKRRVDEIQERADQLQIALLRLD